MTQGPYEFAGTVTPHDTNPVLKDSATRALWVGTGGAIALETVRGQAVTLSNVANGTLLPIAVAKVKSTGTTASNILWLA